MFLTKVKIATAVLLVAAAASLGSGGLFYRAASGDATATLPGFSKAQAAGAERNPKDKTRTDLDAGTEIKKLARSRVDAAHKAYDVAMFLWKQKQFQPSEKAEEVYTWSVRWLNAQRDLGGKKEDHVSALGQHLRRMQEVASVARVLTKAGQGSPLDSPAAEFYLREAELWLAQTTATAKQAGKK